MILGIGVGIAMGKKAGKRPFKVITNDDIYNRIIAFEQKFDEHMDKEELRLQKIETTQGWFKKVGIAVVGALAYLFKKLLGGG